ncbi:MAG: undecaprenyl-diphosphatase [Thermoleophilaceae bacterium]|nr:undecaprenyl-diphosphatase [Thermoleophilaceae bacterium]
MFDRERLRSVDYTLFKTINGLSGGSLADSIFKLLANDLAAVLVAAVALTFLFPWSSKRSQRRCGAVVATAAAAIGLLVNQPIAHLVDRTRPYLAHPAHAHLLITRSHDPSFPSDHATGAFALALGIWAYDRVIGGVLLAIAAVIAFARVYVGTHYPGDVVAGAVIAACAVALLYYARPLRRALEGVARVIGGAWDRVLGRFGARRALA